MEFLGFNAGEFLVWLAIALIVLGPTHARQLARHYLRIRNFLSQARYAWDAKIESLAALDLPADEASVPTPDFTPQTAHSSCEPPTPTSAI